MSVGYVTRPPRVFRDSAFGQRDVALTTIRHVPHRLNDA